MADSIKIRISGDDSQFRSTLTGLGNTATSVFKGMFASQVITKGFNMLANGLKDALSTGMQFESAMSQVAAISGATGAEFDALAQAAKDAGAATMFSASEAASALKYMALAGWDANQSISALGGVLDLAAASGMDLGTASDYVTDYLSAFGMQADQSDYLADMMVYANNKANTSAEQLGQAYSTCATNMAAAGQTVQSTTALLMTMANVGTKGSSAGTALSSVMSQLTQKAEDGKIAINGMDIALTDSAGNWRDVVDIISDIGGALQGLGSEAASEALGNVFSRQSITAINTILAGGIEQAKAYREQLTNEVEGAAKGAADTMMDNLQGDIKVFESSLEAVKITASEAVNGTAREFTQLGAQLMQTVNAAGQHGGIGGMADALIGQIPTIIPKLTDAISKIFTGVTSKLPGLVKKLVAALPSMLSAAFDTLPQMADAGFAAASAVVEGIISRLPELVPMLVNGLAGMTGSMIRGFAGVINSVISGVAGGLKNAGILSKSVNDYVHEAFEGADTSGIALGNVDMGTLTLDGEVNVDAFVEKVTDAKAQIDGLVDSLTLDDSQKAALKKAIYEGSGAEAIQIALQSMGLTEDQATQVTENINRLHETLDSALSGFDLPEGTTEAITAYVDAGGSLEEALQIYAGLDPETAKAKAAEIQPALDQVQTALNNLGIDVDLSALTSGAADANAGIAAALKMLGVDDETISSYLESIDTLSVTITDSLSTLFETLKTAFTDGDLSNDAEVAENSLSELDDLAQKEHENIDSWLADYTEQLAQMSSSAEDYKTAVTEAEQTAQTMHDELNSTVQAAKDWVTDNAGAKTDEVTEHVDELDAILGKVQNLEARIEALKAELGGNTSAYGVRTAVEAGAVNNKQLQAQSIELTYKERQLALEQAAADYGAAIEEAGQDIADAEAQYQKDVRAAGTNQEALEQAEQTRTDALNAAAQKTSDAETTYAEAQEAAARAYNEHINAILAGILKSNGTIADVLQGLDAQEFASLDFAAKLKEALLSGDLQGNGISVDDLLSMLGFGQEDLAALAETLGVNLDALSASIQQMLEGTMGWEEGTTFFGQNGNLINFDSFIASGQEKFNEALGQILEADPTALDGFASVIQASIDAGLLDGIEGIDLSDPAALLSVALSGLFSGADGAAEVGENVNAGVEEGMADTSGVESAGENTGREAVEAVASGAQTASPSRATIETGKNVAAGLTTGIQQGQAQAVAAAQQFGQAVVQSIQETAGEMSGAFAEALGAGSAAAATAGSHVASAGANGMKKRSSFYSVGQAMGNGFNSGLASKRGAIIATATSIAQAAAAALAGALKVNSPSKVTMAIGRSVGEGFEMGMAESLHTAIRSAQTIVGDMNLTPREGYSEILDAIGTNTDTVSDAAALQSTRPLNVYFSGRRVSAALASETQKAKNNTERRLKMGIGK